LGNAKRCLVVGTDAGEMPRTMRCRKSSRCTSASRDPCLCFIHTWYDLASNRIYRQDAKAGTNFDELYSYLCKRQPVGGRIFRFLGIYELAA
jgi:hypothetical protein